MFGNPPHACGYRILLYRPGRPLPEKKIIKAALAEVAKHLGNTPAICRKCYVHPEILAAYLEGDCIALDPSDAQPSVRLKGLSSNEARLLALLDRRLRKLRR